MLKYLLPFPEHQIYLEVFGGSAVVLLNKVPVRSETYNDINENFVNFWNVIKDYNLFLRIYYNNILDSRKVFNEFLKEKNGPEYIPPIFTALENAMLARKLDECNEDEEIVSTVKEWKEHDVRDRVFEAFSYYYRIHHSFSFKGNAYNGMSLNWKDARNKIRESFVQKTREDSLFQEMFKILKTIMKGTYDKKWDLAFPFFELKGRNDITKISKVAKRIQNTRFDCQDFRKIIPRFDKKGVLMYLDPPYFKSPEFVSKDFKENDHIELLFLLKNLKNAKFVLSIDDGDLYTDDDWTIQEIVRTNMAGAKSKKNKTFTEYIVRNFNNAKVTKMNKGKKLTDFA